jgi:hypothetical protein
MKRGDGEQSLSVQAHLPPEEVGRYARRELPRAEWVRWFNHIAAGCRQCAQMVDQQTPPEFWEPLRLAFGPQGSAEGDHLTEQEWSDYLNGRLHGEQLERIKQHVNSCESCGAEWEDLQDWNARMQAQPPKAYGLLDLKGRAM